MLALHIGAPKAGSSSLQRYFTDHRDALRKRGIHYPDSGCVPSLALRAHHNLGYEVSTGNRRKFNPSWGDWSSALKEIGEHGVISTESLFRLPPHPIRKVRQYTRDFDVRVVAFLRRQDLALESAYNQLARFGRVSESIEEYWRRNRHLFDYAVYIDRWGTAFDNLIVVPFEAPWITNGVAVEMLRRCGFDGLPLEERRMNTKAGLKSILAISRVLAACRGSLGDDYSLSAVAARQIVTHFRNDPEEVFDYRLVTPALSDEILGFCQASNERLGLAFAPPDRNPQGGRAATLTRADEDWLDAYVAKLELMGRQQEPGRPMDGS